MQDSTLLVRANPLPVERILFDSPLVRVGSFRCAPEDPLFVDSGPIVNSIFVFPRTGVWIQHEGREPFVADPTIATLYNRGQVYRRRPLSKAGDHCDWFAVSPQVLTEIVGARDHRALEWPERPFPRSHAPVDNDTYVFQRRLVERIARDAYESLFVEEQVIWLASRLLARATENLEPPERHARRPARASRIHRDHCEHAREVLAARFREALSLAEIAALVGVSSFHLCRVFRRYTSLTLHEYRTDLRLRHALERVTDARTDLVQIALELGFSSHSHFTTAFRRAFGMTPSALARDR